MNRKITIVSATEKEIEPFVSYLRKHAEQHSFQTFTLHGLLIDILYSGIGILHTTYSLMDYLSHRHPDGWIQAGIGGAFETSLRVGEVYQVQQEMISGFGAEDRDGKIIDPFTLGWNDPDSFPYTRGVMACPYQPTFTIPIASGMTTFYAHGQEEHITKLRQEPHGQIENMEGAAFFYISLVKKIPFLSIRSISNIVEARNKENWNAGLAINNLNEIVKQLIEASAYHPEKLFRTPVR
jgi:futalosine hydrolase